METKEPDRTLPPSERPITNEKEAIYFLTDSFRAKLKGNSGWDVLSDLWVLESDLSSEEALELMLGLQKDMETLSDFSESMITQLARVMTVLRLDDGEIVMKKGEQATFAGIVMEGKIAALVDDLKIPLKRGTTFGEMSYFEQGKRTADVVADGSVVLAVITFKEIAALGETDSYLQHLLTKLLSRESIHKLRAHAKRKELAMMGLDFDGLTEEEKRNASAVATQWKKSTQTPEANTAGSDGKTDASIDKIDKTEKSGKTDHTQSDNKSTTDKKKSQGVSFAAGTREDDGSSVTEPRTLAQRRATVSGKQMEHMEVLYQNQMKKAKKRKKRKGIPGTTKKFDKGRPAGNFKSRDRPIYSKIKLELIEEQEKCAGIEKKYKNLLSKYKSQRATLRKLTSEIESANWEIKHQALHETYLEVAKEADIQKQRADQVTKVYQETKNQLLIHEEKIARQEEERKKLEADETYVPPETQISTLRSTVAEKERQVFFLEKEIRAKERIISTHDDSIREANVKRNTSLIINEQYRTLIKHLAIRSFVKRFRNRARLQLMHRAIMDLIRESVKNNTAEEEDDSLARFARYDQAMKQWAERGEELHKSKIAVGPVIDHLYEVQELLSEQMKKLRAQRDNALEEVTFFVNRTTQLAADMIDWKEGAIKLEKENRAIKRQLKRAKAKLLDRRQIGRLTEGQHLGKPREVLADLKSRQNSFSQNEVQDRSQHQEQQAKTHWANDSTQVQGDSGYNDSGLVKHTKPHPDLHKLIGTKSERSTPPPLTEKQEKELQETLDWHRKNEREKLKAEEQKKIKPRGNSVLKFSMGANTGGVYVDLPSKDNNDNVWSSQRTPKSSSSNDIDSSETESQVLPSTIAAINNISSYKSKRQSSGAASGASVMDMLKDYKRKDEAKLSRYRLQNKLGNKRTRRASPKRSLGVFTPTRHGHSYPTLPNRHAHRHQTSSSRAESQILAATLNSSGSASLSPYAQPLSYKKPFDRSPYYFDDDSKGQAYLSEDSDDEILLAEISTSPSGKVATKNAAKVIHHHHHHHHHHGRGGASNSRSRSNRHRAKRGLANNKSKYNVDDPRETLVFGDGRAGSGLVVRNPELARQMQESGESTVNVPFVDFLHMLPQIGVSASNNGPHPAETTTEYDTYANLNTTNRNSYIAGVK